MSVINPAPWPIGTSVELHRQLSGSGEPGQGTLLATVAVAAGVGYPGGPPTNVADFRGLVSTYSGPAVATAVVGSKRVSVRTRLGG